MACPHGSGRTASVRKCGLLLVWLDKEMTVLAPIDGNPGRSAAIRFSLTNKVPFPLSLRQTTGRVASLLKMAF
ncbi:MAG: IS5/IS1182 family transposase, partial [Gemmobacter sp.]